ncbi:hypothetical protein GW17_00016861 [Ensete ventricosum]|nr:hypothetical protein GW17_00016861 [Ensete ventricosum]RZS03888.1 hypothetical protein BHM03_00034122 [Ensete ventricosum]
MPVHPGPIPSHGKQLDRVIRGDGSPFYRRRMARNWAERTTSQERRTPFLFLRSPRFTRCTKRSLCGLLSLDPAVGIPFVAGRT